MGLDGEMTAAMIDEVYGILAADATDAADAYDAADTADAAAAADNSAPPRLQNQLGLRCVHPDRPVFHVTHVANILTE